MKDIVFRIAFLVFVFPWCAAPVSGQQWTHLASMEESMSRVDNGFMSCRGIFYLLGGRGIQPVAIFDPTTNSWTEGADPPVEIHHFQAVRLGEELWVVGAFTGTFPDEKPLEHIYIYHTKRNEWRRGPALPTDRLRASAGVAVYRGSLYMIGGARNRYNRGNTNWVDRYDTKTGKWKKLADAPRTRDDFHAGICDGKIYAAGGRNTSWYSGQIADETIAEVDVYDIESGRWYTLPEEQNLPTPRAGTSTVTLLDNILVIGGESMEKEMAYKLVEAYDVHQGKWFAWDTMNKGRFGTQAVMCVGAVFIAGGRPDRKADAALLSIEKLEL